MTRCGNDKLRGEFRQKIEPKSKQINLQWIMELYKAHRRKEKFFERLSIQMNPIEIQTGSVEFRKQIIKGVPEKDIRASREPGMSRYKEMRKEYLLYD